MRRRWLVLIVLMVTAAVLLRWSSARIVEWARQRAEQALVSAFRAPAHVGALEVSLLPPRVRVAEVNIGGDAPVLALREATVAVDLLRSIRHGCIDASLAASGVFLSLDRLPKSPPGEPRKHSTSPSAPWPFEVSAVQLDDIAVRFVIDHEAVTARAPRATGRVGMSRERPYVTFGVHAPGAELQRGARRLVVSAVDLDAGVLADQFFVDRWTIRGEHVSVSAVGEALPPAARHRITGDLPSQTLAVIFDPFEAVAGALHVDGVCNGELFDPVAEANVQLADASVRGLPVGNVRATFTRRGRELAVPTAEIAAWGGQATASFSMTAGGATPASGRIAWRDLDAMLIGHFEPPVTAWSVGSEGHAELSGTLNPIALRLRGGGTLEPRRGEPATKPAQWTAELAIGKHELGLNAAIEQGGVNQVRMALTLADGDQLNGTVEARLDDVARLAPLTPPPLRDGLGGSASARATVHGPVARPTVAGSVTADRLAIFGATLPRLRGNLEWSGGELAARDVQVTTATGSAEIAGVFALNSDAANAWRVKARALDFAPFTAAAKFFGWAPPLQGGVLDGSASCNGSWLAPDLDADLSLRRSWLIGEPVRALRLRAQASRTNWSAELSADHTTNESLSVRATGQGNRQVQATLESTAWQLSHLRGAGFRGLDGMVTLRATVGGAVDRPSGSLHIDGRGLTVGGHRFGDATLTAQGSGGDWSADAKALDEALQARATWQIGGGWPFTLQAELARTDIAALLLLKSYLHVEAAGSLGLHGRLAAPADLGGDVRVESLAISRQAYAVQASEPIVVHGEHGRFEVVRCTLAGSGSSVRVSGSLASSGAVDLGLSGEGDLEIVELLIDPVQSARGAFNLDAQAHRSAAGLWSVQGSATVRNGDIDAGLPIALTNMDAALSLAGDRIVIEDLAGKAGGGSFRLGGALDVNRGPDAWWSVREVALPLADGFEARVSGQGKLTGTWELPSVSGDVEVLNALYDRNLALTDLLPWLRQYLVPTARRESAVGEQAAVDLRVYAHDGVYIDNNVAKVEMWLDLQVAGTTDTPVIMGTIGFLSGEAIYQERTFTVTGGSIDFRDPRQINPLLNITAESQVTTVEGEYTVRVAVSGTADNPRVQFTADDPSLSQNDVLSLVAFGKTAAQLQREGGKFTSGSALTLIPTGPVEQQVRQFAGLDRFEIDATQARDTGAIEPRLTVGKDLTEQIRALASTSFGIEARRTVQLEYRMTPRFSLLGSWESDAQSNAGAFGGGVKFRYEFRRLPLSLFNRAPCRTLETDAP